MLLQRYGLPSGNAASRAAKAASICGFPVGPSVNTAPGKALQLFPATAGGKFLKSSAAVEFGRAVITACRNCGDSTVIVVGGAWLVKWYWWLDTKKNSLSLTIG